MLDLSRFELAMDYAGMDLAYRDKSRASVVLV